MVGCHKNSMSIILRYLYAISQFHVEEIGTCKLPPSPGNPKGV